MNAMLSACGIPRLEATRQPDTGEKAASNKFADLTLLATQVCHASIGFLSFFDSDRQRFQSMIGLEVAETPRSEAYCTNRILQHNDVLEVRDPGAEPGFLESPLVKADPRICFFAGAPLIMPGGRALGALCVMDRIPRALTPEQLTALRILSRQVVTQLELRRQSIELAREAVERNVAATLLREQFEQLAAAKVETDRLLALARKSGRVLLSVLEDKTRAARKLRDSEGRLRALAVRIQGAREEERTKAAREIHDVLSQELTGLKMDLAWLSRRMTEPLRPGLRAELLEKLTSLMELTDRASHSVQRIAAELRPVVLDSLGLCAATEWVVADFQKRTEIQCEARVPVPDLSLDHERSTALFRILQESLTNAARHSRATKIDVYLRKESEEIVLTVRDNGRGVQLSELEDPRSVGLMGMRERAALLEGECTIKPLDDGGTQVEARLPIDPALLGGGI